MSSKIRVFACVLFVASFAVAGCGESEEEFGTGFGLGKSADGDADDTKASEGDA